MRILAIAALLATAPDGTSGLQMERWRKYGLDGDSILAAALCAVQGR